MHNSLIDQGAIDNETTLLKMYQQEALLKQKEGDIYNNLATQYGNISVNGSGGNMYWASSSFTS